MSFDWRVHQTQSNKNGICSDNWSSCNARISMVKAGTLFEYQLKIAWSNNACKYVDGLWPHWLVTCFLNWRPRDRILAGTLVEFCDVINIFDL